MPALSATPRENKMLTWISNIYYLVATLFDTPWQATKNFARNWAHSRYR